MCMCIVIRKGCEALLCNKGTPEENKKYIVCLYGRLGQGHHIDFSLGDRNSFMFNLKAPFSIMAFDFY
jgi:hypothetical protein